MNKALTAIDTGALHASVSVAAHFMLLWRVRLIYSGRVARGQRRLISFRLLPDSLHPPLHCRAFHDIQPCTA
jgi:hypothetical protein